MSASIYYQPIKGTLLPMGAQQSFLAMLRRLFNNDTVTLYEDDLVRLNAAMLAIENGEHKDALQTLVDAVEKHGAVRVWPEY